MNRIVIAAFALAGMMAPLAHAQEPISFADSPPTMIIGHNPGGGTDITGRLIAMHIGKHLPGKPNVIVQNQPGAEGMVSLNHLVNRTKPDGKTIIMGANIQVEPANYRKPQAQYDPATFHYFGGVGRGGTVVIINKEAEPRLNDKSKPPVIMGSIGGMPRTGMTITAWGIEHLGWNAKWVVGYPGTNEVMLALDRGEIDMTSTGNMVLIKKALDSGKFKILVQSGTLEDGVHKPRSEFPDVPVFPNMMQGKIKDPVAKAAFDYWLSSTQLDKWVGLIGGTPKPIVDMYRKAFLDMSKDPEFMALGKKNTEDFTPMPGQDIEASVKVLTSTPQESLDYMGKMLRKQGIDVKQ
ncbi:MAG: hypothetical protein QOD94_2945 [Alphaproteobacteria bacterium]|nr:hypothetical protein [Alphaproteobacteria bacterium]